jgi:hypothetical protein
LQRDTQLRYLVAVYSRISFCSLCRAPETSIRERGSHVFWRESVFPAAVIHASQSLHFRGPRHSSERVSCCDSCVRQSLTLSFPFHFPYTCFRLLDEEEANFHVLRKNPNSRPYILLTLRNWCLLSRDAGDGGIWRAY